MTSGLMRLIKTHWGKDKQYYKLIDNLFGFIADNIDLYKLALIHRSASMCLGDGTVLNNERLEFLGDAVLEAIVSDYLFIELPDQKEGFLSQLRSRIVSRSNLNRIAIEIGIDKHIVVQHNSNAYIQKHLYGNTFEAMIGAIYLDKGYDFVNRLIINRIFYRHLDLQSMIDHDTDHKSRLIEFCQREKRSIHFVTGFSSSSTSHNPHFHAIVQIDGQNLGEGEGPSKKEAEQLAAQMAYETINSSL